MSEFELIDTYCRGIGPKHNSTVIDVGDDAAVFRPTGNKDLAVSTDTMVEGIHFLAGTDASHLGHKILNVNCSDMAAMGAEPKYATLSLTMPSMDAAWLQRFSDSLKQQAEYFNVQLIGGDTTKGTLTLSLTIIGLVNKDKIISRSGAKLGDDVYVSNVLGDAALGLASLQGQLQLPKEFSQAVELAHNRPQARVELGQALLEIANAGLDISDGLVADLGHVCSQSEVGVDLELSAMPLSPSYRHYLYQGGNYDSALFGGDDYELAFCCSPRRSNEVNALSDSLGLSLTKIGTVVDNEANAVRLFNNGKLVSMLDSHGFNHFS